jgi:hypothetical protein
VLLLAMAGVLHWHGQRELDAADLVAVPLVIVAVTCLLMLGGQSLAVTTAAVYLAAWHRGRQNFGIARFYQERMGGPPARWHRRSLHAAIHLPMAAGVAYFTSTAPLHEGQRYLCLAIEPAGLAALGAAAVASLAWSCTTRCSTCTSPTRWPGVRAAPAVRLASCACSPPSHSGPSWLTACLVGGLLCHYWLDGRIWTSRARRGAGA